MSTERGLWASIFGSQRGAVSRSPRDTVGAWLTQARLGLTPDGAFGQRRRQRWPWNRRLLVRADCRNFMVHAADISADGIGVVIPRALTSGDPVWIRDVDRTEWVAASVRHVHGPDDAGLYRIGLQFELDCQEPPPA